MRRSSSSRQDTAECDRARIHVNLHLRNAAVVNPHLRIPQALAVSQICVTNVSPKPIIVGITRLGLDSLGDHTLATCLLLPSAKHPRSFLKSGWPVFLRCRPHLYTNHPCTGTPDWNNPWNADQHNQSSSPKFFRSWRVQQSTIQNRDGKYTNVDGKECSTFLFLDVEFQQFRQNPVTCHNHHQAFTSQATKVFSNSFFHSWNVGMRLVGTMGQKHRIARYKEHLCNVVSAYVVTYVIWGFLRRISLRKYYTAIQSMYSFFLVIWYISVVCFFLEKCYGTDVGVRGPCSMASVSYPVALAGGEVRLPFKSFFPGCILFRIHSISRTKLKTLILGARMLKSIPFPVGVSQKSDKGNSIIAIPARYCLALNLSISFGSWNLPQIQVGNTIFRNGDVWTIQGTRAVMPAERNITAWSQ